MMRQRLAVFLMIALEAAIAEHMLFEFEWYPVILAVLAVVAVPGLIRINISRKIAAAGSIAIGVFIFYGTSYFLFAHRLPVIPFLGVLYPIGWYLLTMQVAMLYVRGNDEQIARYEPLLGAGVFAYFGLAGRHGSLDIAYHAAALSFILLMLLLWHAGEEQRVSRRARVGGWLLKAGVLTTFLAASFITSNLVGTYRNGIDVMFFNLVGGLIQESEVGFSTQARLGSIERLGDKDKNKIALRVFSKGTPPYLRGRAYDTLQKNQWQSTPRETPFERMDGQDEYKLGKEAAPCEELRIAPVQSHEGCLFSALNAVSLRIPDVSPTVDENGNLRTGQPLAAPDYEITTAVAPGPEPLGEMRGRYLAVPAEIDPRVRELAATLFANCATPREKVAAVVDYFKQHYKYHFGFRAPGGEEPISYFLLNQAPAHCEYFASGAVVLLRIGGVPCRYVTGFVADEYNKLGRYWVACNRGAHAWVEAYDDERQIWVTVEPTVSDGLPENRQETTVSLAAQLWDYAKYLLAKARGWIAFRGFGLLIFPVMIALLVGAWRLLRGLRRFKRKPRKVRKELSPQLRELVRLRKKVDRRMRRYGLRRGDTETTLAFAARIAASADVAGRDDEARRALTEASEWYRRYGEARFSSRGDARELRVS